MKKPLILSVAVLIILFFGTSVYQFIIINGYDGYDSSSFRTSSERLSTIKNLGGTSYLCDFTNALKDPYDPSSLPGDMQVALQSAPVTTKTTTETLHNDAETISFPALLPIVSQIPPISAKANRIKDDRDKVNALLTASEVTDEIRYCDGVEFALASLFGFKSLADSSTNVFPGMTDLYKEDIGRFRTQLNDLDQIASVTFSDEHALLKAFANKAEATLSFSASNRRLLAETVNADLTQLQTTLDSISSKTETKRTGLEAVLEKAIAE